MCWISLLQHPSIITRDVNDHATAYCWMVVSHGNDVVLYMQSISVFWHRNDLMTHKCIIFFATNQLMNVKISMDTELRTYIYDSSVTAILNRILFYSNNWFTFDVIWKIILMLYTTICSSQVMEIILWPRISNGFSRTQIILISRDESSSTYSQFEEN
jgi:hypothetical protein